MMASQRQLRNASLCSASTKSSQRRESGGPSKASEDGSTIGDGWTRSKQVKRTRERIPRLSVSAQVATLWSLLTILFIVWPSLDKDKINNLRTLRTQKPYNVPVEKAIPLWARALSVPEEHVEAWLKYNTEEVSYPYVCAVCELIFFQDDDFADERKPLLHLPTPEATASPEPSYSHMANSPAAASPVLQPFSSVHPTIKQQQHSPVQPIFIHTTFPPSPLHSPLNHMRTPHTNGQPTSQATPPVTYPLTPVEARPKMQITIPPQPQSSQSPETSPEPISVPPVQALLNNLAVSITELKASGEADSVVINSIEDFDRAFEPYERIMHAMLAKTQDGTFAPLGLVPSAISVLPQPGDDEDFKIDIDSMQERE